MRALRADLCQRFVKRILCALCDVCIERERDPSQPSRADFCLEVKQAAAAVVAVDCEAMPNLASACASLRGGVLPDMANPAVLTGITVHSVAIADRACEETNSASATNPYKKQNRKTQTRILI